jgi:hypothetical protein
VLILTFKVRNLISTIAKNLMTVIIRWFITSLDTLNVAPRLYTISVFIAKPIKRAIYTRFIRMLYSITAVIRLLIDGALTDVTT